MRIRASQCLRVHAYVREPCIEVLEGLDDPSITNLSAQSYMGFGYHRSDSGAGANTRTGTAAADAPAVLSLWARDIEDVAYRRGIYEKWGLDGRVSLIGRAGGQWRSVNFYKHVEKGGLTDQDVVALTKRAQVLVCRRDAASWTERTAAVPNWHDRSTTRFAFKVC